MAEVLAPNRKPLRDEFARSFAGMTHEPGDLAELEEAREAIITAMVADMPEAHRHFLLGFKRGDPDWDLLGIADAQHLPAVLWKLLNLDRLTTDRRRALVDTLENILFP